jgi:hypothetical protein
MCRDPSTPVVYVKFGAIYMPHIYRHVCVSTLAVLTPESARVVGNDITQATGRNHTRRADHARQHPKNPVRSTSSKSRREEQAGPTPHLFQQVQGSGLLTPAKAASSLIAGQPVMPQEHQLVPQFRHHLGSEQNMNKTKAPASNHRHKRAHAKAVSQQGCAMVGVVVSVAC